MHPWWTNPAAKDSELGLHRLPYYLESVCNRCGFSFAVASPSIRTPKMYSSQPVLVLGPPAIPLGLYHEAIGPSLVAQKDFLARQCTPSSPRTPMVQAPP